MDAYRLVLAFALVFLTLSLFAFLLCLLLETLLLVLVCLSLLVSFLAAFTWLVSCIVLELLVAGRDLSLSTLSNTLSNLCPSDTFFLHLQNLDVVLFGEFYIWRGREWIRLEGISAFAATGYLDLFDSMTWSAIAYALILLMAFLGFVGDPVMCATAWTLQEIS